MDILKKVTIPAEINGHKVTKICDGAFRDLQISLIEFEASDNIESIGMGAFYNCPNLSKITIPSNMKIILPHTFDQCTNLKEIKFPVNENNITNISVIENGAFNHCTNLTDVTIPEGVIYIGSYSFNYCQNICDIEIPTSVKKIESSAFNACWLYNKGTITFNRKDDIEYSEIMLYNDPWITICVPEESKEMYENCFALFRSWYHDHEIELITFKSKD